MILGVLIGRKTYPMQRYLFVLMIVIGVILFMYKDQVKSTATEYTSFGVGETLILLSLTMDGLTGAVQVEFVTFIKLYIVFFGLYLNFSYISFNK